MGRAGIPAYQCTPGGAPTHGKTKRSKVERKRVDRLLDKAARVAPSDCPVRRRGPPRRGYSASLAAQRKRAVRDNQPHAFKLAVSRLIYRRLTDDGVKHRKESRPIDVQRRKRIASGKVLFVDGRQVVFVEFTEPTKLWVALRKNPKRAFTTDELIVRHIDDVRTSTRK
jgi:hypothetical protein